MKLRISLAQLEVEKRKKEEENQGGYGVELKCRRERAALGQLEAEKRRKEVEKETIRVEREELEGWRTIGEKGGGGSRTIREKGVEKITIEKRGGMEDKCGKTAAA